MRLPISPARAFVPYPATDEDRPLESGMVISIETAILHPTRGFIKLEDTVAVTDGGWKGSVMAPELERGRNLTACAGITGRMQV